MSVAVDLAQGAVSAGAASAERWLGRQIADLPGVGNLLQLTETMARNERQLAAAAQRLIEMRDVGLAQPKDYRAYEASRVNVYRMHTRFYRLLGSVFRSHPEVLRQLPRPQMGPKVTEHAPPPQTRVTGGPAAPLAQGSAAGSGTAGLGNPAVPAAAAAIPAWMMAAILLIIFAAIVLAITLVIAGVALEEVVRDVLVTQEQLHATHDAWEQRMRVYEDCRSAGRTPEQCSFTAAETIPMPPEVARELPRPTDWVKWVTIGVGIVAVSGFAIWGIRKYNSSARRGRAIQGPPKYRQLSAEEFLVSDGGDYGMDDT